MNKFKLFPLLFFVMLTGCGMGAQFRPFAEPKDGPQARLRVISHEYVQAIPGRDCLDGKQRGTGTVLSGWLTSKGYRGRSIGMPDAPADPKTAAEFMVAANEPITISMLNSVPNGGGCNVSGSFTPEEGKDYELRAQMERGGNYCSLKLAEIAPIPRPLPLQRAQVCKKLP